MNYKECLETGKPVVMSIQFREGAKRCTLQAQQMVKAPVSESSNAALSFTLGNSLGDGYTRPTALITAEPEVIGKYLADLASKQPNGSAEQNALNTAAVEVLDGKSVYFTGGKNGLDLGIGISELFGTDKQFKVLVIENNMKNPFSPSQEPKQVNRNGEDSIVCHNGVPVYRHTALVPVGVNTITLGRNGNTPVTIAPEEDSNEIGGNYFLPTTDFMTLEQYAGKEVENLTGVGADAPANQF